MIHFGPIRLIQYTGYLTSTWNPELQLQDMSSGHYRGATYTQRRHVNSNCHDARSKEPEKFMDVEHMSNDYIKAVYVPHLDCKVEVTHRS